MKDQVKKGDTVETYCCGKKVIGEVVDVTNHGFFVKHASVKWGDDTFKETYVANKTKLL